jgi:hypothetical protein
MGANMKPIESKLVVSCKGESHDHLSFFCTEKSSKIIPKETPHTPSKKETILLKGIGNKYLRLNHFQWKIMGALFVD